MKFDRHDPEAKICFNKLFILVHTQKLKVIIYKIERSNDLPLYTILDITLFPPVSYLPGITKPYHYGDLLNYPNMDGLNVQPFFLFSECEQALELKQRRMNDQLQRMLKEMMYFIECDEIDRDIDYYLQTRSQSFILK